jgi:conjugal transfer/type IV secretion protein DotA/TraY
MTKTQAKWIKYALLPGIISRLYELFTSGFSTSAYWIACIYQSVKLLPPNHPYVQVDNIGKFGIRHVIGEAANNLQLKPQNIDQIVIFFGILTGMVLLLSQIILLVVALLAYQPVMAQSAWDASDIFMRDPAKNYQDIVMILLDRVFGIADIFGSCVSVAGETCTDLQGRPTTTPATFPFPFHLAFHQMLEFYSYGLFFIGLFIILYFVITIVGETAASGSPFGQRYNKTWFPVRIMLFFALLIPIGTGSQAGLNAAQILTFRIVKGGSNMASNAWENFNTTASNEQLTGQYDLIAQPNMPELDTLPQFIFLAKTCKIAEETLRKDHFGTDGIQAYVVRPSPTFGSSSGPDTIEFRSTDFAGALAHTQNGQIEIRFGSYTTDTTHDYYDHHNGQTGNVWRVCGSMTMDVGNVYDDTKASYKIQELYYDTIKELWENADITTHAKCLFDRSVDGIRDTNPACTDIPDSTFMTDIVKDVRADFSADMRTYITDQAADASQWNVPPELIEKGWGGAAIWYNRIAQINGAITGAVFNLPAVTSYPFVMEYVALYKKREEENPNPERIFNPQVKGDEPVKFYDPDDKIIAFLLNEAHERFTVRSDYSGRTDRSFNPFLEAIDYIFGINGIYDLLNNPNVNPMAQLSTLGKGMMDAAIRNVLAGKIGGIVSKVMGQSNAGQIVGVTSDFISTVGLAMLAISFTLYFILPLMPFIYFFFAVGGWVKGIFEAIVAMPLWALAHITRWDGDGIPGPAGTNGYMLLLEILLRPILILSGLIASILIFSAMIMVLNDIFALVIGHLGGFNTEAASMGLYPGLADMLRGPIDELFYTAVYTILCYIIAQSSFKLIDQIPNQILRYMNFTIKTFQETSKNAAEQISGNTYRGVVMATNDLKGGQLLGLL